MLATVLILAGALALLDAAVTLVWQEPVSALYAAIRQEHLSGVLHRVERAAPTPAERRTLASLSDERTRIAFLADELDHTAVDGSPVGRIVIPRIGVSFVVVKGTGEGPLKSGPGIYPLASFPGGGPTTVIAGHRTTYLAPFRHIDELSPGTTIRLNMPYASFTYSVVGQRVVGPEAVQAAIADAGYTRLVLSACTPVFSAAKRLLVYARLMRTVPRGAAMTLPGGALAHPFEASAPAAARAPNALPHMRLPPMLEPVDRNLPPAGV